MFKKIKLYFFTIYNLKAIQIFYQIFYLFKKHLEISDKMYEFNYKKFIYLNPDKSFYNNKSFYSNYKFQFLNIEHEFKNHVDWNFDKYGKLWLYNLNYFDYLNQKNISKKHAENLILDFIYDYPKIIEGKDPYPTSLRIINIIKFISKNKIKNKKINHLIYNDSKRLLNNIEYHILGNHILENSFALIYSSLFFDNKSFYDKGFKILNKELKEQILDDGGHFELSPMYHNIILIRILNLLIICKAYEKRNLELIKLLENNVKKMLSWSSQISFNKLRYPLFNDSANKIIPEIKQIFDLAERNEIKYDLIKLNDSGYRKFSNDNYQIIVDVANLGPDYQLAHAHADTFNFELYIKQKPIIIDKGISNYNKSKSREEERATHSHNTVQVDKKNSSQVWDIFRVARRAKVISCEEGVNYIKGIHDGYKNIGVLHSRKWNFLKKQIKISDEIFSKRKHKCRAYFHFHPDLKIDNIDNTISVESYSKITFKNFNSIKIKEYNYSPAFNQYLKSKVVEVVFFKKLETYINII